MDLVDDVVAHLPDDTSVLTPTLARSAPTAQGECLCVQGQEDHVVQTCLDQALGRRPPPGGESAGATGGDESESPLAAGEASRSARAPGPGL